MVLVVRRQPGFGQTRCSRSDKGATSRSMRAKSEAAGLEEATNASRSLYTLASRAILSLTSTMQTLPPSNEASIAA